MKKKIGIITGITCLFISILCISFGYWIANTEDKNIVFQTNSKLADYIEYDSGESKFVGDFQIGESYLDGVHTTVSIKKTDSAENIGLIATINMDIALIGDYMSSTKALKWAITSGDSENPGSIINQGNFQGTTEGDTITLAPYIEVTTTKQEYTVWIWLDGSEDIPDKITGETIDTRVWTYVEQDYEKKFKIDSLKTSGNFINSTVINSTSEIVEYAVTTTSEEPTEWIQTNLNSKTFNLEYEVNDNGTYYIWFKDSDGDIIYDTISVVIEDLVYTITYDTNGGSWPNDIPDNLEKEHGNAVNLTTIVPTKTGYTFNGWNTASDGSGTNYESGSSYNIDANVTLYAKWDVNYYYLDIVNGWLDGAGNNTISGYGTVDIYINGQQVANDVTDYYVAHPYGSTYEIKDIKTASGKTYIGLYNDDITTPLATSGTITETIIGFMKFNTNTYYLDINGILDGSQYNNISGYGTVDVYINGQQVADDVADYYAAHPYGSTYEIKDVKTASGKTYIGLYNTDITTPLATSGTITGNIVGFMKFNTNTYYFDINGLLDGTSSGNISGYGTVDVYINGQQVANDVTDYYTAHPHGSTYEIKDIKAASGKTYIGLYDTNLTTAVATSGTITGTTTRYMKFNTSAYTISYNANGGSWTGSAPANQTKYAGTNITLTSVIPKRNGYVFKGWSTSSSATSATYVSGATYSANASATLYAVWGQCSTTYYKNCPTAVMCYSGGQTTVYSRSGFSGYAGYLKVSKSSYPDSAANAVYLISKGSSESTLVMVLQSYCNGLASWYNDSRTGCASGDISSSGFNPVTTYGEAAYVGYMDNVCIANNGQCGSCSSGGSASGQTRSCFRCTLNGTAWYQWGYDASMSGSLSGASCQKVGTTGVGCD